MSKRIWNKTCPFCDKTVQYWPNYSPRTSNDYGNVGWTITKRNTRIFFHKSCYYEHVKKQHQD